MQNVKAILASFLFTTAFWFSGLQLCCFGSLSLFSFPAKVSISFHCKSSEEPPEHQNQTAKIMEHLATTVPDPQELELAPKQSLKQSE